MFWCVISSCLCSLDLWQIARRFLMWAGFKCEVVPDGKTCVERVRASAPFDMILMDCQV